MSIVEDIYTKGKPHSIAGYQPVAMPHIKYIKAKQINILLTLKFGDESTVPGYFIKKSKMPFRVTHELTRNKYLIASQEYYYTGILGSHRDDTDGIPCIVPNTILIEENISANFIIRKIWFKKTEYSLEEDTYLILEKDKTKQEPLDFDISAMPKPHFSSKDIIETMENAFSGKHILNPSKNIILLLPHSGSTSIESSAGVGDAILRNRVTQTVTENIFKSVNNIQLNGITFRDMNISYNNIPDRQKINNQLLSKIIHRKIPSKEVNWIINSGDIGRLTPSSFGSEILSKSELPLSIYGIESVNTQHITRHSNDLAYALFYNRHKNYAISNEMKQRIEQSIHKMQEKYRLLGEEHHSIFCNLTIDGTIYEKGSRAVSSISRMFGIPPEKAFVKYFKKIFLNNIKDVIDEILYSSNPETLKREENMEIDHAIALNIIGRIEPASREDIIKEIKNRVRTIKRAEEIFEGLERESLIYHDTQNKYRRVM